jgi:hypothetical protein
MARLFRAVTACACAAHAMAQSSMSAGCDTQAMLRDITSVQTACCESGLASDCATGLPETCSDTCRPVFLGFLSTYRGNGCARTLEIFGETLNLHPLEVDCNGGVDSSHPPARTGVCDLKTALTTCQSHGVPAGAADIAAMCADPCMAGLIPCARDPALIASMGADESQTLVQLQQLCGAEDRPGGNRPGDGACSVADMQTTCDEHPLAQGGGVATDPCANPCVLEMLDCASDPTADALLDQTLLLDLQHTCQSSAGDTGPGDGNCNLVSAGSLCGANDMDASDPSTFCQHSCVLEMIDCIDDPQLADHRSDIVTMQSLCAGQETSSCVGEIGTLDDRMQVPCCGGNPCPEGPPAQCSVQCAQIFVPFYDRCGTAVESMAAEQPKGSNADDMSGLAAQLAQFYTDCQRVSAGGGH